MGRRIFNFFTSLRLTVACLIAALVLVFVGTLAQVDLGLYAAQSKFFRSFLVFWTPANSHLRIPILPGGWLIGTLLLINLLAAHAKRFKFTPKKYGILMIHAGLIFLLVGQFGTELFQVESTMRIEVGQTRNYTEAPRKVELAVIDVTDPAKDKVTVIPASLLAQGGEIRVADLPFTLNVEKYLPNSVYGGPMLEGEKIKSSHGIGKQVMFALAPPATGMDSEDNPTALIKIISDKGPVGEWIASTWMTRYPEFKKMQGEIGVILTDTSVTQPQSFSYGGRQWQIALRPLRYYKPYNVTLLAFNHDLYPGTDVPKNFSSRIHLNDPSAGEDRDILIYMNNPLRYRGETFYQSGFDPDNDRMTILQVVRNPASITPYAACSLVALGLVTQFLMHLIGFARKRAKASAEPAPARRPVVQAPAPVTANGKRSHL